MTDLNPPPSLADPWAGPIPLDGSLERHKFSPFLTAFLGLTAAFILFQVIISPIATVLLLLAKGVPPGELLGAFETLLDEHARVLLTANTVGQVLGLALPAWLFARLHTSRPGALLRWRSVPWSLVALAVLALAALIPFIQWLGALNQALPLPETLRDFEAMQVELIEKILATETRPWFNLFVLALVPAFCEELLFRGYVQRQAERSLGILGGILFSGIIFGLYHLRLTQALPLSVLGLLLAYLVWRTGSLWPAIAVHFANNALAVAVAAYVQARPDLGLEDVENVAMPWYLVLGGLLVFAGMIYVLEQAAKTHLATREAFYRAASGGSASPVT